jgi:spore germination protein KA
MSEVTNVEIYKLSINQFIDKQLIDEVVLRPIAANIDNIKESKDILDIIKNGKIYHMDAKVETDIDKIVLSILSANFVLVCQNEAFIFNAIGFDKRAVDKPESETSVKGAKESFIESAAINVSLIRRRLQTEKLKVLDEEVGEEFKTKINIMYVEGIAKEEIIQLVKERIKNIKAPCIVSVSDFEEHIVDRKYSIFPQIIATERPDKVAANLIEGKVVIMVDGFPTAYIVPSVFPMFMQASEEYSVNYFVSSFIRVLRYVCILIATLFPAIYIAITTFHHEMLPTTLAESIIQSKQNVPLPAFLEVIIMLIAFEVLLEAGVRMPKTAGQTVSIIGALIVGEAAVNAKFVSPIVVVIVAISAICGFVIPNRDLANAIRLTRLGLVIVGSMAGFFGISIAVIVFFYYLSSIESFGVPYLRPFASNDCKNVLSDTVFREIINKSKDKMTRW